MEHCLEVYETVPRWITIIGCGTLGSAMAYAITLRSLHENLEQLILVDNDVIEEKNLPYLTTYSRNYLRFPKGVVLEEILRGVNPALEIKSHHTTYPDLISLSDENKDEIFDTCMIDCRDTPQECPEHTMKLNLDGGYGIINVRPRDNGTPKTSRYVFGNTKYYAMLFAGIATQVLFGEVKLKHTKTAINLRKGELHGIIS